MSEEGIDATLRKLRLQKRNVYKVLNDMTVKSRTDAGITKEEVEREKEGLEPLIESFVKNANQYIETLRGSDDELIEGWEMHVELVDIKWQKFLAFEKELNLMIKETVETPEEETNADEGDTDMVEKPSRADAVADSPVTIFRMT